MSRLIDLTGMRFGKLTVIDRSTERSHPRTPIWMCQCDCGNRTFVRGANLRSGNTESCGCLRADRTVKHGQSKSREYNIWLAMIQRCVNPNNPSYHHYGGRGITVCESWRKFENFWSDMCDGYEPHLTIERINNDAEYSPENCRWATREEQAENKRTSKLYEFAGQMMSIKQWAIRLGISRKTLSERIRRGWGMERALTTT